MSKIYAANRQSGKTTFLIEESAKTGATIVEPTYVMVNYAYGLAHSMGVEIPEPITINEYLCRILDGDTSKFLIDELSVFLSIMNVDTATLTMGDTRDLDDFYT